MILDLPRIVSDLQDLRDKTMEQCGISTREAQRRYRLAAANLTSAIEQYNAIRREGVRRMGTEILHVGHVPKTKK
jgi:flagellar biosynthesis chaperone FliJ